MLKKTTVSEKETLSFGQKFAQNLQNDDLNGRIIALYGDLGSGKTTFVKGLAQGLKVNKEITSPTFVIYKPYASHDGSGRNLYHFDLYRLEDGLGLEELGFKEIIHNPKNIIAIEWPDKATTFLPKKFTRIKFSHGKKSNIRLLEITK